MSRTRPKREDLCGPLACMRFLPASSRSAAGAFDLRGGRSLVQSDDLFQVGGCEPVTAAEHGEWDLPCCRLALQPALLHPQDAGGFVCGEQRRCALLVVLGCHIRAPVISCSSSRAAPSAWSGVWLTECTATAARLAPPYPAAVRALSPAYEHADVSWRLPMA